MTYDTSDVTQTLERAECGNFGPGTEWIGLGVTVVLTGPLADQHRLVRVAQPDGTCLLRLERTRTVDEPYEERESNP